MNYLLPEGHLKTFAIGTPERYATENPIKNFRDSQPNHENCKLSPSYVVR